jgi:alpha-mannosidase
MTQQCFLVCNAHLDPVWLWPWEDGLVEAISTFRVAADFCDEHPDFVFNHNEALLYEWVERNDPELFARIQRLVASGQWHIAGGSYVQPDLIAASGESLIRQYLVAKAYFREKFGVEPTTAYNFDSFGHPQGLIQILAGCGFDSYVFCRPNSGVQRLPIGAFRWRHASGVEIIARRSDDHYITQGEIRKNMKDGNWPAYYQAEGDFMFLWGIGNHGGGPSRDEYAQFAGMRADFPAVEFLESTPEAFFQRTLSQRSREALPVVSGDFKPFSEGCYTSMQRVKSGHRRLENLMRLTETLAAMAWWRGRKPYPAEDLTVAWKDILFAEFHDFLPGSSIPAVETDALSLIGHAEEILRRKKAECQIALLRDEPLAERNTTPLFVFNPHSWAVTQEVEIEYGLDRQYKPDSVIRTLSCAGEPVIGQFEKGELNLDDPGWGEWRQKAVFLLTVPPLSYKRVDTDYTVLPYDQVQRWSPPPMPRGRTLRITTDALDVAINHQTGLVDRLVADGQTILSGPSLAPQVFADWAHSWETPIPWCEPVATFRLATPDETAAIIGSDFTNPGLQPKAPVSIIEDGPIRTVVEAVFVHERSWIVQHYIVNKLRPVLRVEQTIFWTEHDKMLRLELGLRRGLNRVQAEKCYSVDDETRAPAGQGLEQDFQRFLRFSTAGEDTAFAVVSHGIHGYRCKGQTLRLSLLRSPAYGCMSVTPDCRRFHERYIPRHDQGLRSNRLTLLFGALAASVEATTRAAYEENVPLAPFVYFPTTRDAQPIQPSSLITGCPDNVLLTAMKRSEDGADLVLRFWEVAGRDTAFTLTINGQPCAGEIGAHRLQTFRLARGSGQLIATDLLERLLGDDSQGWEGTGPSVP